MKLYEVLIGLKISIKGKIWCTDGSFLSIDKFRRSDRNKEAYGYAVSDNTVASIKSYNVSFEDCMWSTESVHTGARSLIDGEANSRIISSLDNFSPKTYPAVYKCINITNAGRSAYMPAIGELMDLYNQIMGGHGSMKHDLRYSGVIYECNYAGSNWDSFWSSTECNNDPSQSLIIEFYGSARSNPKDYRNVVSIIPFFRI